MERIEIRTKGGVGPNAKFVVRPTGFLGPACAEATRGLERRLGLKTSDAPTEEMYREPEQETDLTN